MNFTVWSNGLDITTSVQGIVSHAGSAWAASDSADTSAGCQVCGVQYIPDMPITTYFSRPRAGENVSAGRGKTIGVRCAPAPIATTRREIR